MTQENLLQELRNLKGDSIIAATIRTAAEQGKPLEDIRAMVKDMASDNYTMMGKVLGWELLDKICIDNPQK